MSVVKEMIQPEVSTHRISRRSGEKFGLIDIHVRGAVTSVRAAEIDGKVVIATGKWIKTGTLRDEELIEGPTISNPDGFVAQLKASGLGVDVFTFGQKLHDATPAYNYRMGLDNFAVILITTFEDWWERCVDPGVRRAVRKAAKAGLEVRVSDLDDDFVNGIVQINNETPLRQGRRFWHYQKSFEDVKKENSTYSERTQFLGAYYQGELIGFIRLTYCDNVANIVQLLSITKHYDKRPANALIAKAVEVCVQRGMSQLVYYNYVYNDPNSTLTEFKRRNGFEKLLIPRYYIPLTAKGALVLRLGLERGLVERIPKSVLLYLLKVRRSWCAKRLNSGAESLEK
jgi:hypothetical protein